MVGVAQMAHVYFSPLSVDCRPIGRPTYRLSADYRPTVDRQGAKVHMIRTNYRRRGNHKFGYVDRFCPRFIFRDVTSLELTSLPCDVPLRRFLPKQVTPKEHRHFKDLSHHVVPVPPVAKLPHETRCA